MTKTYNEKVQENARNKTPMKAAIYRSIHNQKSFRFPLDKPLDFSDALWLMKQGVEMTRHAWIKQEIHEIGEDEMVPTVSLQDHPYQVAKPEMLRTSALFLQRQNEQGVHHPWTPNNEDLFADDWIALGKMPKQGAGTGVDGSDEEEEAPSVETFDQPEASDTYSWDEILLFLEDGKSVKRVDWTDEYSLSYEKGLFTIRTGSILTYAWKPFIADFQAADWMLCE